uniref:SFRICE_008229 n=1 Tax=Spodoptera frugiperda TaxID=7108 RepID=A0A2H1WHL1_SPOFR
MEADPPLQEPRNADHWDNDSPDGLPKRRRIGRKRKRRPQTSSTEDLIPQERYAYADEEPRPYFDVDFDRTRQTTEMPKRRRKKTENRPTRWTDDVMELERPMRRRGQRRKRPSLDKWPELSEFSQTVPPQPNTEPPELHNVDDARPELRRDAPLYENKQELAELSPTKIKVEFDQLGPNIEFPLGDGKESFVEPTVQLVQDKSLSEFSSEDIGMAPIRPLKRSQTVSSNDQHSKPVTEKSEKLQDSNLMDPLTLKDILKRSNGTSLSEILQQHNLSLTDLLNGKQHAVSIFKSPDSLEALNKKPTEPENYIIDNKQEIRDKGSEEQTLVNVETKYATQPPVEYTTPDERQTEISKKDEDQEITTTLKPVEPTPKISTRRRFPIGTRKKLRMRPMLNNTYKGQLSRDLVAMNSRKYSHHRRNATKSKEWKDVLPMMLNNTKDEKNNTIELETTTAAVIIDETTIAIEVIINNNNSSEEINVEDDQSSKLDDINMDITETTTTYIKETTTETPKPTTEKPTAAVRPAVNTSGLRRQAFNNRLKRKRLKHKNATTEPPQDDLIKHLFGLGSLVSSSEFIARTQNPKSVEEDTDTTALDDFITTESSRNTESDLAQSTIKVSTVVTQPPSATEETAKIEIEEILNDTRTSAKLSKILKERNMTLSELVEHRERGSSHVHLADIFHNASREPNPPEPFLSKSLLEPISKETYPLRALLDANLHDPNTRITTDEPTMINNINIPVVMDYRNNVNENAENMGIMSLFNNFTKAENKSISMKDSEGTTDKATELDVDVTNATNVSETNRDGRVLKIDQTESQDDVVSWNEIFSLMGRNHNNDTPSNNLEGLKEAIKPFKKIRLDEDVDGDGLIVLEDLQHLTNFENNIASGSDEKIEMNPYESSEPAHASGILDKIPSQTKSVTVATASIAGLAMVLFLLTYAVFKWKQQRSVIRKKRSFGDERIPTPVFENRKGHKNNSSTRSISPMLQTTNIYTLNTLDSQNGKDSPDYMWDTLRKPFQ